MKIPAGVGALAPGRISRPGAAAASVVVALALCLASPDLAHAGDETPTQWQIDARAEALQTAPAPPEKPVICIVDTGVTPTPDLDIVSRTALDGGTPDDVTARPGHYGHGTTVAHMAAAKVNGWGSSGAFPHARIASVRIFDDVNQRVPWQTYVRALEWCANVRPAPVVAVLSLGSSAAASDETTRLRSQIERSRDRAGMSVVAAAGNGGGQTDMPARLPETFSVSGSSSGGDLCAFSARGDQIDLLAPGCDLLQAGWDGTVAPRSGTSFSAPLVAGVLAALRAYHNKLAASAAENLLLQSSMPGSFRRLAVDAALRHAGLGHLISVVQRQPSPTPEAVHYQPPEEVASAQHLLEPRYVPAVPLFRPLLARQVQYCQRPARPNLSARRSRSRIVLVVRNWRPRMRVELRSGRWSRVFRHRKITIVRPWRKLLIRSIRGQCSSQWVSLSRSSLPN